jgi:tetratricopeptide (TPR) repeat protein
MQRPARDALVDAVGLGGMLLFLLDYLRPSLLFLPTILAGGDTPCHYPTAEWFSQQLLPRLRFHGWYPGAYLGHPLLLYYFPLPFLVMAGLRPAFGPEIAFKLGVALGILLVPLLTYLAFRRLGFRAPGPLLGAAASVVFLLLEKNPIWGGTIASTMTGEFSYTYGVALGVLFLGVVYRAYSRGGTPALPAALLALTALAHGYAVLWAGLSAAYFLYASRRPARTLGWLILVALLAFALAAFHLLPLLASWGTTTPYDDPWIDAGPDNLVPPYLLPMLVLAGLGLAVNLLLARRNGGADQRLLFLLHAGGVAAALAAAGPALGIIDVRFVPFAQLALCLVAAAAVALAVERFAAPGLLGLGVALAALLYADGESSVSRAWIEYNFSGLQAKEHWPAWSALAQRLRGTLQDPRVAIEYHAEHEKAGSIRMYETLPFFSGRSTLEGVYNQASLQTHFVYYVASELGESSPNPFRSREYSSFDIDNALRHLRLLGADTVVALSPKLTAALAARGDLEQVLELPPYAAFRMREAPGYVEPLAYRPVRSAPAGWRDKAYRWFSRKPQSPVHLVFSADARFDVTEPDEWLAPPARPLPVAFEVEARLGPEEIRIRSERPGHPLLVKVSYHPRWRAIGADGPYLVSPALMLVVPRETESRLVYAPHWSDRAGAALSLAGVGGALWLAAGRRRRAAASAPQAAASRFAALEACGDAPRPPRRWGGVVPAGLLLGLSALRPLASPPADASAALASELYERASRAYAGERYSDAAEYLRHAIPRASPDLRTELLCLRGESLLRSGLPAAAVPEFQRLLNEAPRGPHAAQALFGLALAEEASGLAAEAVQTRQRLRQEFPDTPWARRLGVGPQLDGSGRGH